MSILFQINVRKTEYVLLDVDRQVHVGMDRAIQLKSTGRVEWTDGRAIVACIRLINGRRAAFYVWLRNSVGPRTIGDDVRGRYIVHQVQHIAFMDSDRGLQEGGSAHVNRRQRGIAGIPDAAGTHENGKQSHYYQPTNEFFMHGSSFRA